MKKKEKMKITNVSYQTNYSNNKSNNSENKSAISHSIHFRAFRAEIGEPIKKSEKLLKWAKKTGLALQDKLGLLNVTTISYSSPKYFTFLAPKNLHALADINLEGAKIKGRYKAGQNAIINNTKVAPKGRLSVDNDLKASNSIIEGAVESVNANFENINLTKDGTISVLRNAVIGNGTKLNGTTDAGTLYFKRGSELSKDGYASAEDHLILDGKIKGLAVAKSAVVETSGSVEKGGKIWAEHVHFNDFLPKDGEIMAEKITIGRLSDPDFVLISDQTEVPPNYRNTIKLKKQGWFASLVDSQAVLKNKN